MRRRLLSLALALVMCLGLAVPVLAKDDDAKHTGNCTFDLSDPDANYNDMFGESVILLRKYEEKIKNEPVTQGYITFNVNYLYLEYGEPLLMDGSSPSQAFIITHTLPRGTQFIWKGVLPTNVIKIEAYSDTDGDGVYDRQLLFGDGEKRIVVIPPAEKYGPEIADHYFDFNIYAGVPVTEYHDGDLGIQKSEDGPDSLTLTVDSDKVYEIFGANTYLVMYFGDGTTYHAYALHITNDDPPSEAPAEPAAPSFTDVPADAYYAAPVAWAVKNEITSGTGDNKFSPSQNCTNAQILTFIWRAYGKPEPTIDDPFTNSIPDGYKKAAVWAHEKGMVSGTSFDIDKPCTRAMAMTYLWQAAGSPETEPSGKFTDVAAGAPYAQAVAWAVANGITKGATDTTFAPENICQRGQIAVFLYNALADKA